MLQQAWLSNCRDKAKSRTLSYPLASSRSCPNASILCDILLPTDALKYPGAAGIVLGGPTGAAGPAENTNGAEFGAGMLGAV